MSRMVTVIIFLALLRTISEPFRIQYYSDTKLTFDQVKPFLLGGLVTGIGLLVMTLLSFYGKHRMILVTFILTIMVMLIIKSIYLH